MRIQQRGEASATVTDSPAVLWLPELGVGVGAVWPVEFPHPESDDRYVTVDERVEGTVGVVAAEWPVVDAFGLRFRGRIEPAWYGYVELQSTVDRLRRRANQVERPLRIGDTFWVRGFSPAVSREWEDLRDITSQARTITKAAVAVALLGPIETPADDLALAAGSETLNPAPAATQLPPGGAATARPTI